jgi:hypothetical protein
MSHLNLSKGCFLLAIPTVGRGIHGALGICQKVLRLWQSCSQACTHWYQMQRSGMFNHFSQLLWQTKNQVGMKQNFNCHFLDLWISHYLHFEYIPFWAKHRFWTPIWTSQSYIEIPWKGERCHTELICLGSHCSTNMCRYGSDFTEGWEQLSPCKMLWPNLWS